VAGWLGAEATGAVSIWGWGWVSKWFEKLPKIIQE